MKLQFRLRTLMIVVTLLAVPLGYVGRQAKIVRKRRWFQFRLRTLMIVTMIAAVACRYVVHERGIVQERRAILADEKLVSCFLTQAQAERLETGLSSVENCRIPLVRELLGDRAI